MPSCSVTSEKEGQLQPRLDAQPAVKRSSIKTGRSNFRIYKETKAADKLHEQEKKYIFINFNLNALFWAYVSLQTNTFYAFRLGIGSCYTMYAVDRQGA